jgi:hypothetical protein
MPYSKTMAFRIAKPIFNNLLSLCFLDIDLLLN